MTNNFNNWPSYTTEEAECVKNVLLSNNVNYWTGGHCKAFEKEFALFCDTQYAISLANGTVALELALIGLNIGKNDEVIVTPRTFIASASSIINVGATPVFADVDAESQNITKATIEPVLTNHTKAIICVHLAGWPCDMDPILQLANEKNIYVIEDCAQAHGAKYKGKPVGSLGDVGCWSFCQDKIITTGGEGGMVTTNNKNLWHKMWSYKDHGKSWEAVQELKQQKGFKWLHHSFGTNWRMTEIQAAIGRLQLQKMNEWNTKRNENLKKIFSTARKTALFKAPALACEGCDGNCKPVNGCNHAAYKCYLFLDTNLEDRNAIIDEINSHGIPCFEGSCSEIYLEKAFQNSGLAPKVRFPAAKKLGETSVMFLCHPTLEEKEIDQICKVIEKVDKKYSKKQLHSIA